MHSTLDLESFIYIAVSSECEGWTKLNVTTTEHFRAVIRKEWIEAEADIKKLYLTLSSLHINTQKSYMHACQHTHTPTHTQRESLVMIKGRGKPNGALQVWFQQSICQERCSISAGRCWANMTIYVYVRLCLCALSRTCGEQNMCVHSS